MKFRYIIFMYLFLLSSAVTAGPLGFSRGMSIEDIKKLGVFQPDTDPYWYAANSINKGHDNFEKYLVLVTPAHGLCKVIGIGRDIDTNSFGDQLKSRYKELTSSLIQKYGRPSKEFDFLRRGSIWNDDHDFMMGLTKKDRTLSSFWFVSDGVNLPDNLTSISIKSGAISSSKGFLNITYEFDNVDRCLEAVKSRSNQNL